MNEKQRRSLTASVRDAFRFGSQKRPDPAPTQTKFPTRPAGEPELADNYELSAVCADGKLQTVTVDRHRLLSSLNEMLRQGLRLASIRATK